ncbi:hypothetical protein OIE43_22335 [Streptomyces pseudovenezuelae]|uniref:hypothetical protein n=1 Tax=Streptomyces pseudovenezuelae TaxID=67350 RepID=UPI002E30B826|nr:hypothetical protein [Streptomyces pseudovenezuelae]
MPSQTLLGLTENQFSLQDEGGRQVWLKPFGDAGQRLCDAANLVIRGEGYATEEEAAREGERWRDVISRAFARAYLAADFGDRQPVNMVTKAGEKFFSNLMGHPVLAHLSGVTVFEDQPGLRFLGAPNAEGCRLPSEERNRLVFAQAARLHDPLNGRERVAFDLYSGSFFQPSADSRLLMLTMAIETLLVRQSRSDGAQAHVTAMIEATKGNTDLTDSERNSVRMSLKDLRSESIGQAGKRLARTLKPRTYAGQSPDAFFSRCYTMRSVLTHGHVERPDRREVDILAASLALFVADLLAGRLLTEFPD